MKKFTDANAFYDYCKHTTTFDDLDLRGCAGLTYLPDNLTVGGYLSLNGCTGLTRLPDNLTVGGYLDLRGCTGLTHLPDNLTVGGDLYLNGCTGLTRLPVNLTVGGSLSLDGCTGLTHLPDNLTVGGYLYLNGCTGLTRLPDNLTVGGYLDLNGCAVSNPNQYKKPTNPNLIVYHNGSHILADGILSRVISRRKNVYKTIQVGKSDITYVVVDGDGNVSHGDTIRAAKNDLIYKRSSHDTSKYKYKNFFTKPT